ncbi:DsbA family protein [Pseudothauera nasutitermitis]|uniref:DsbA family protein n=1 Tax=Pseudothauera nasutitermitis TaxID=2565930 RepID=A0A4S4B0Y6_9RHOO|nr:DsbA family protein [Pseudothauera nasutitermitis]THF66192.1 DsbA family protein [Pseudothauera nasutitermitis]
MNTLHYIFDPLCGWCYAAAPLLSAAAGVDGLRIALHGGGMMTGTNRRQITPQWREYVLPHDRRIAELTGQPFGNAYIDGLLRDNGALLDSAPPTTAILAAQALEGQGLAMLHRVQSAHYVEGRRIADPAVLHELAVELGLDAEDFEARYAELAGEPTGRYIEDSRRWLARVGGQGFPTLALESPQGTLAHIDTGLWLGRAEAFAVLISGAIGQAGNT